MPRRRIPLQSVTGDNLRETKRLHDLFYLGELERQADIFMRSFTDAMRAVDADDQLDVWRHLQAALFAGIIANRLVRARNRYQVSNELTRLVINRRAARLRHLVGLVEEDGSNSPILTLYDVRNSVEHIDERIDIALAAPTIESLSDCYLSDGLLVVSPEDATPRTDASGLRAFNPETGLLHFDRRSLNMFVLDLHMITLLHNARDAQSDLLRCVQGRQRFASGPLVAGPLDDGAARAAWQRERQSRIAQLVNPAPIDGYVRVWLQPREEE